MISHMRVHFHIISFYASTDHDDLYAGWMRGQRSNWGEKRKYASNCLKYEKKKKSTIIFLLEICTLYNVANAFSRAYKIMNLNPFSNF